MAIALVVASAYMLRYTEIASGAGTDNTLTRTQMLADAKAGPLKAKLEQANTTVKWANLHTDPDISVNVSATVGTPAVVGAGYGNPGSVSTLQLTALAAGTATVEIRFNHSIDR